MIENRALTTFETLRDELGLSGTDQQTALERYVMIATDKMTEICNRTFHRELEVVDRLRTVGEQWLYTEKYPVRSIESIVVADPPDDSDDSEDTISIDSSWYDWQTRKASGMIQLLIPTYRRSQVIDRIALTRISGTEWFDYRVTYDGGYVTPLQAANDDPNSDARDLPFDLEELCVRIAVFYWRQRSFLRELYT